MMVYNQTSAELKVYVADLADYNAGILRGAWFDPTEFADADEFAEAVDAMIRQASDENGTHEEFAIHDFEAPSGVRIDEYETLGNVWTLAALFVEYGAAYAAYRSNVGAEYATEEGFTDAYCGEYASMADYAMELFEETSDSDVKVSESWPFTCIDWEHAGRELTFDGYSFVDGFVFRDA